LRARCITENGPQILTLRWVQFYRNFVTGAHKGSEVGTTDSGGRCARRSLLRMNSEGI
jgi:hypothetical protein